MGALACGVKVDQPGRHRKPRSVLAVDVRPSDHDAGTAQSLAIVKLGTANYTIDTVTKANDTAAAGEAAAIVRSFGP